MSAAAPGGDACPDARLLRGLAEREGLAGIIEPGTAAAIEAHVAACARCQRQVRLLAREDRALQSLGEPLAPDERALEATLAAVRRAASGGGRGAAPGRPAAARPARSSAPWVALGLAAALALGAFAVLRTGERPAEAPSEGGGARSGPEEPGRAPVAPPEPGSPRPTPAPPSQPAPIAPVPPAPDHPVSEDATPSEPDVVAKAPPSPAPPVAPETPGAPPPSPATPTPGVGPERASETRTIARAVFGTLMVQGRPAAEGAALALGMTVEAGAQPAGLECEGAASFVVAPRTKLLLASSETGAPRLVLSQGKALATTTGALAYEVATADVLLAPVASEGSASFALAVEGVRASVTALDGAVRVEARKPRAEDASLVVRAGFAVSVASGRAGEPSPADAAKATEWLPRKHRPRLPAAQAALRKVDAGDGRLVTAGKVHAPDPSAPSGFVAAVAQGSGVRIAIIDKSPCLVRAGDGMSLELVLRADRAAGVEVMLWDAAASENYAVTVTLEAGRWRTVSLPLRDFKNKAKSPRPIEKGDPLDHLYVNAEAGSGAALELDLRSARFLGDAP